MKELLIEIRDYLQKHAPLIRNDWFNEAIQSDLESFVKRIDEAVKEEDEDWKNSWAYKNWLSRQTKTEE